MVTGNVLREPLDAQALRGLEQKYPRGRALCSGEQAGFRREASVLASPTLLMEVPLVSHLCSSCC